MLLYFAHSPDYDYKAELYGPLMDAPLGEHELILPLDEAAQPLDQKSAIKAADIIFAEVSHSSTDLGLQIGWATTTFMPIVALHRVDVIPEACLRNTCQYLLPYKDKADLAVQVKNFLDRIEFEQE